MRTGTKREHQWPHPPALGGPDRATKLSTVPANGTNITGNTIVVTFDKPVSGAGVAWNVAGISLGGFTLNGNAIGAGGSLSYNGGSGGEKFTLTVSAGALVQGANNLAFGGTVGINAFNITFNKP